MKRIKKLIIANLVVILLAIIIFSASMYFGGPVLEQGSRDILVLAGEQDEQQGGSVDMAYMVHLENGSLANFTPVYPGGSSSNIRIPLETPHWSISYQDPKQHVLQGKQ